MQSQNFGSTPVGTPVSMTITLTRGDEWVDSGYVQSGFQD